MPIGHGVAIPLREVEVRTSRSSGPGGQHANVTASRVEVVFDVNASAVLDEGRRAILRSRLGDRVTAIAQDSRSQYRNRELALQRLQGRLSAALIPPRVRRTTRPTASSVRRRERTKRIASARKRLRRDAGED